MWQDRREVQSKVELTSRALPKWSICCFKRHHTTLETKVPSKNSKATSRIFFFFTKTFFASGTFQLHNKHIFRHISCYPVYLVIARHLPTTICCLHTSSPLMSPWDVTYRNSVPQTSFKAARLRCANWYSTWYDWLTVGSQSLYSVCHLPQMVVQNYISSLKSHAEI